MVKIVQSTVYVTKAGTKFDDMAKAEKHEAVEELAEIISEVGYFSIQEDVEAKDIANNIFDKMDKVLCIFQKYREAKEREDHNAF